jgi:hypothetical protein
MNISAMIIDREDRRTLTETCPVPTLFTSYLIWRGLTALLLMVTLEQRNKKYYYEIQMYKSWGDKKYT